MKPSLGVALCVCLLFMTSACSAITVASSSATPIAPTPVIAPTATPIVVIRTDPQQMRMPNSNCNLITPKDVADIFAAEVNQPMHQSNQANQVIFPAQATSANESYCIYLAFHRSGSMNGAYYQVTYWTDTPDKATPQEWAQVWTTGEAKATQKISGIGDAAFYEGGRLTFKKGSTYVTIELISDRIDTKTAAGVNQQLDLEKQFALRAVKHMES